MPGMPVSEQNCHPFQWGRYMWMHNGMVGTPETSQQCYPACNLRRWRLMRAAAADIRSHRGIMCLQMTFNCRARLARRNASTGGSCSDTSHESQSCHVTTGVLAPQVGGFMKVRRALLSELSDAAYDTVQSFHSDSAVCFSIFLHHLPDLTSQHTPNALLHAMEVILGKPFTPWNLPGRCVSCGTHKHGDELHASGEVLYQVHQMLC